MTPSNKHGGVGRQQKHGLDNEIDGMAADFAMWMKEVTVAVLDRIMREVKQLSESVRKVNDQQTCFESVLQLGPWAN